MTTLEMPNGARATLQDGAWSSSTLGLANLLERMMPTNELGPEGGDPEYTCAHYVASKVAGRIIQGTPNYEHVPERGY